MPIRVVVKGPRVQEVSYRLFLYELTGPPKFYAYNLGEDSVVAIADGDEKALESFTESVRKEKPPKTEVEAATIKDY